MFTSFTTGGELHPKSIALATQIIHTLFKLLLRVVVEFLDFRLLKLQTLLGAVLSELRLFVCGANSRLSSCCRAWSARLIAILGVQPVTDEAPVSGS